MKNIVKITIFSSAVFILAVSVWFSPVLFKGYPPHDIGSTGIILGRNLAQTGEYAMENGLNILLSSNLVKEQAHISTQGNKLTPLVYGKIFEVTGQLSEDSLILLTSVILALTLVIFTLLVLYLFGFKIALSFSLIYIFLPFNWLAPYSLAGYEFALLFFSLFFLLYFWSLNRKYGLFYLAPAGAMLGLAVLAKEAFFLFLPAFFVYLWLKKQKRSLLYILIPLLIIFGSFWLPDALKSGNAYLLSFTEKAPETLQSSDYGRYSHVFPDPYTYHFEKDEFLENLQKRFQNSNFLTKTNPIRALANIGVKQPSILERIASGIVLFFNHLSKFFSLEEIGGPFIFLLIILGGYSLRKRNNNLLILALGWIFSVIFLLSFVTLGGRGHLMDFGWIIALFISLGVWRLASGQKKSAIISAAIMAVLIYNLVLVNHVVWGKLYDQRQILLIQAYSQKIKELNIRDQDVIAVAEQVQLYRLNYLNNKSLVIFKPLTIENLLNKEELDSAFEKFNIKYVLGYSDELSQKITSQTEAVNIASNSLKVQNITTSGAKMWLMNLIR